MPDAPFSVPLPPDLLPRRRDGVIEFPVHHVRGGTSTGLVLHDRVAPADRALREELLRHLMGVPLSGTLPGNRQLTGLGRSITTSNKVFFADMERDGTPRLVATFAQLAAESAAIDWSVNCGNMTAALPLWALDTGMVARPEAGRFDLDIRNTNTGVITRARMRFRPDGRAEDVAIPGVDGSFPGVDLFLSNPVGAKTGKLLPTGHVTDRAAGVTVSCLDVAMPVVIARAADFGHRADEPIEALESDRALMDALRAMWVEAGLAMGLTAADGHRMTAEELARSQTIPKVCLVGPPTNGGNLAARYFTPQSGHRSMAVSGACCLAVGALVPGTIAHQEARGLPDLGPDFTETPVGIENPAGILATTVEARATATSIEVRGAAYARSTQILLRGYTPLYRASAALEAALA